MNKSVSFSNLEETLKKLGAHVGAAETHGLLTGMISMAAASSNESALRSALLESLECGKPSKKQWGVLNAAGTQIKDDLNGVECGFNMLLPNDEEKLSARIDALGFWCRGYLSGLGLAGVTQDQLHNDTVKELVQDLSQIAHVSIETDESEEDEENYMELVEFVRVAVQNIKVELSVEDQPRILH